MKTRRVATLKLSVRCSPAFAREHEAMLVQLLVTLAQLLELGLEVHTPKPLAKTNHKKREQ